MEIVFQEQLHQTHFTMEFTWDHFHWVIADPCCDWGSCSLWCGDQRLCGCQWGDYQSSSDYPNIKNIKKLIKHETLWNTHKTLWHSRSCGRSMRQYRCRLIRRCQQSVRWYRHSECRNRRTVQWYWHEEPGERWGRGASMQEGKTMLPILNVNDCLVF